MKYLSNLPEGELICAGVKSPGVGKQVKIADGQVEYAVLKGHIILSAEGSSEQGSAKKK